MTEEAQIFLLVRNDLYGDFEGEDAGVSLARQLINVELSRDASEGAYSAKREQLVKELASFCASGLGLNGAALEDVQRSKRPGWVRPSLVR